MVSVRKEEDILSMMSAIKSQFGGADICINNAGLAHDAPLLSGSAGMWKEVIEVSRPAIKAHIKGLPNLGNM